MRIYFSNSPPPFSPTLVPPPSDCQQRLVKTVFMLVWLNPVCAALTKQPPRLTSRTYRQNSPPRVFSTYSSLLVLTRPISFLCCSQVFIYLFFFFLSNERENQNKQTSGNAQMCRCTNRLNSSPVVAPGRLRGQNNKGHQLHAMGQQCTGGTIVE